MGLVAEYKLKMRTKVLNESIEKVQKALEEAIVARDAAQKALDDFVTKKRQDAIQAQDLAAKDAEEYPLSNGTIAHIRAPVLPQARILFFESISEDEKFLERKRLETMARVTDLEAALQKLNLILQNELNRTD